MESAALEVEGLAGALSLLASTHSPEVLSRLGDNVVVQLKDDAAGMSMSKKIWGRDVVCCTSDGVVIGYRQSLQPTVQETCWISSGDPVYSRLGPGDLVLLLSLLSS